MFPLVGGEYVEDTVESSRGTAGVQRGQNQVTGFSCGDRERNRLEIAHLTHHDDIRILTQGSAKSVGEALCMSVNLALVHMTTGGLNHIFDGIFQGDDVIGSLLVDFINQGCQSGRLT